MHDAALPWNNARQCPAPTSPDQHHVRAAEVRDWQVISYGNTLHGFTNPAADGSMMRTALYSEQADRRSWAAMRNLLEEAFRVPASR